MSVQYLEAHACGRTTIWLIIFKSMRKGSASSGVYSVELQAGGARYAPRPCRGEAGEDERSVSHLRWENALPSEHRVATSRHLARGVFHLAHGVFDLARSDGQANKWLALVANLPRRIEHCRPSEKPLQYRRATATAISGLDLGRKYPPPQLFAVA